MARKPRIYSSMLPRQLLRVLLYLLHPWSRTSAAFAPQGFPLVIHPCTSYNGCSATYLTKTGSFKAYGV